MTPDREAAIRSAVDVLVSALVAATEDPATDAPDRLLSVGEAGALLGLRSRSTVAGLIASGQLRSIRLGRRRLIPSSAVRELIERPETATTPRGSR
jgi:excisionase family DNA binding protein